MSLPIGRNIFDIIGFVDRDYYVNGGSGLNIIYVPLHAYDKIEPVSGIYSACVKAKVNTLDNAIKECNAYLLNIYKSKDVFEISTLEDMFELEKSMTKNATLVAILIASVSLLVGGIGIMNVLLIKINERIREIGIRRASGARKIHILYQFLFESLILTMSGGIIGVCVGIVLSKIIALIFELPIQNNFLPILITIIFSSGIGIVFGIYPSIKASKVNPIKALGYE